MLRGDKVVARERLVAPDIQRGSTWNGAEELVATNKGLTCINSLGILGRGCTYRIGEIEHTVSSKCDGHGTFGTGPTLSRSDGRPKIAEQGQRRHEAGLDDALEWVDASEGARPAIDRASGHVCEYVMAIRAIGHELATQSCGASPAAVLSTCHPVGEIGAGNDGEAIL